MYSLSDIRRICAGLPAVSLCAALLIVSAGTWTSIGVLSPSARTLAVSTRRIASVNRMCACECPRSALLTNELTYAHVRAHENPASSSRICGPFGMRSTSFCSPATCNPARACCVLLESSFRLKVPWCIGHQNSLSLRHLGGKVLRDGCETSDGFFGCR